MLVPVLEVKSFLGLYTEDLSLSCLLGALNAIGLPAIGTAGGWRPAWGRRQNPADARTAAMDAAAVLLELDPKKALDAFGNDSLRPTGLVPNARGVFNGGGRAFSPNSS